MVAIENGELQVVKLLLKYGAKVDVKLDETTVSQQMVTACSYCASVLAC